MEEGMHIEIHKPELEQRVRRQIASGHFQDVDDFLSKALDALDERMGEPASAHENRTGADLIAALQASPCRDIDIEPERYRLPVRDVHL
jgi:Arc/MetJ-type ribon-helix-helix transcriptional regulator